MASHEKSIFCDLKGLGTIWNFLVVSMKFKKDWGWMAILQKLRVQNVILGKTQGQNNLDFLVVSMKFKKVWGWMAILVYIVCCFVFDPLDLMMYLNLSFTSFFFLRNNYNMLLTLQLEPFSP